jgi:hypothetical protein
MTANLQVLIHSWENLDLIAQHVVLFPDHLNELMDLVFDETDQRNWRAAWILDKVNEKDPSLVTPFLESITLFVPTTKNSGKKRHLLKIISFQSLAKEHYGLMLDYCAKTFTSADEPVAVRVHAMQILYNLATDEKELIPEVIATIENEIEFRGSAGIASRGQKLLKKLYQIKE